MQGIICLVLYRWNYIPGDVVLCKWLVGDYAIYEILQEFMEYNSYYFVG
jgi:hypothetical protein